MPSQIQIINDGLANIGVRSIGSLQENSEAARKAAAKWPLLRDQVLRDCPWNFATVFEKLAPAADERVPGWNFVYGYPSKCVLVRRIFNVIHGEISDLVAVPDWFAGVIERGEVKIDPDFREVLSARTGNKLLVSQLKEAKIEFTFQQEDVSKWDALACKALSFALSAELAWPLTNNRELRGDMEAKYNFVLAEAKRVNFSEGQDKAPSRSTFVESRI